MLRSYKDFWTKSFVFGGVTSRADYWLAAATNGIIIAALLFVGKWWIGLFGDFEWAQVLRGSAWRICDWLGIPVFHNLPVELITLYMLITIVPCLSIQARRLRDAGLKPLLLSVGLIPFVGVALLLIMLVRPSRATASR